MTVAPTKTAALLRMSNGKSMANIPEAASPFIMERRNLVMSLKARHALGGGGEGRAAPGLGEFRETAAEAAGGATMGADTAAAATIGAELWYRTASEPALVGTHHTRCTIIKWGAIGLNLNHSESTRTSHVVSIRKHRVAPKKCLFE